jgi:isopentenyl-diphosphate Delta-isomerase
VPGPVRADPPAAAGPALERVVLVDAEDREVGTEEKLHAHREGLLHRALSVFLFNARGELLLQRRSLGKYHSAGLWTNTCCSHPRPHERVTQAAARRLREELGIECHLERAFSFLYRAEVTGGLIEHEFDHVFIGRFEGEPRPDPAEVAATRWVSPAELQRELSSDPTAFTPWLHLCLERVLKSGS